MLQTEQAFPNFQLKDQDDKIHTLADYAGQWLVIYFYPKDNTSACTLEAQDFTALAPEFKARKADLVGVSPDSVKSHAGFTTKKNLGITLLSDPEHHLLEAAGVWQSKKMYGKEYMGVVRTTVIVDPKGRIREVWSKVKVPSHVEKVLERLIELQQQSSDCN